MSGRRLVLVLLAAMALVAGLAFGLLWLRRGQPVKDAVALPSRCERVRALLRLDATPEGRIELAHQLELPTNLTLGDRDVEQLRASLDALAGRCPGDAGGAELRDVLFALAQCRADCAPLSAAVLEDAFARPRWREGLFAVYVSSGRLALLHPRRKALFDALGGADVRELDGVLGAQPTRADALAARLGEGLGTVAGWYAAEYGSQGAAQLPPASAAAWRAAVLAAQQDLDASP